MRLRMCRKQPQKLAVIRQYMVAVSASLPFAMAGSALAWPSPTLPRIMNEEAPVTLDVSEISWVVSLLFLGSLVSAVPGGYFADRLGRQKTLLYCGVLPIISWGLIILSTHSFSLYAARLIAGLQIGVASTIQPIYIWEISQPDVRDTLHMLNHITANAGAFFVLAVGPFVSYYSLSWFSIVIPVIFLFTFASAPESPYFLMMKGNVDNARESLLWLRGDLNRIELEFELDQIERIVETQMLEEGTFAEIFSNKLNRISTIISLVFSVMKPLSGFGVMLAFATLTLPKKTFGFLSPDDCLIIIGAVTMLFTLLAAFFPEILGQKKLTVGSYLLCSFSLTIVSVWFFLKSTTQKEQFPNVCFVPFLGFLIQAICINISSCPMGGVLKIGIFPTHLKVKSSAVLTMASAITSFILNKFYLIVADWEGMYLNYALYAISCFLAVLFIVCFLPDTKGRSLQEVNDLVNGLVEHKNPQPITRTF